MSQYVSQSVQQVDGSFTICQSCKEYEDSLDVIIVIILCLDCEYEVVTNT